MQHSVLITDSTHREGEAVRRETRTETDRKGTERHPEQGQTVQSTQNERNLHREAERETEQKTEREGERWTDGDREVQKKKYTPRWQVHTGSTFCEYNQLNPAVTHLLAYITAQCVYYCTIFTLLQVNMMYTKLQQAKREKATTKNESGEGNDRRPLSLTTLTVTNGHSINDQNCPLHAVCHLVPVAHNDWVYISNGLKPCLFHTSGVSHIRHIYTYDY